MKNISRTGLIFSLMWLIFIACQSPENSYSKEEKMDPFAHVKGDEVRAVLERAIERAGGLKSWAELKTMKYMKHGILFNADSSEESNTIQLHEYSFQPNFSAKISWTKDSVEHVLSHTETGSKKMENGLVTDQSENSVYQSVMSSLYVLGMPFKLLDQGTNLEYRGQEIVDDSIQVDVIYASYSPKENDNHSTSDEWYYYFKVGSGDFIGALVYHAPTYAFIRNLEFDTSTGIKWHAHRQSFRTDSVRNISFLRAEFWYSDYEVSY